LILLELYNKHKRPSTPWSFLYKNQQTNILFYILEKICKKCYNKIMREFKVKDDKKVKIELEQGEYDEKSSIHAYDSRDMHQVGYLNFRLKGDTAFIYSFKVDDSEFLRTGVGAVMLNCFEDHVFKRRAFRVDGRFYPDGEGAKYSKDFYEKHGYEIYRDGYEQYISKRLTKDKLQSATDGQDYTLEPSNKTQEQ
jgi:hypothetical protein